MDSKFVICRILNFSTGGQAVQPVGVADQRDDAGFIAQALARELDGIHGAARRTLLAVDIDHIDHIVLEVPYERSSAIIRPGTE